MADIEHSTITDPNIHEPKGVAAATADQVYVSDGAGSGDWTDLADLVTSTSVGTLGDFIHVKQESNTPESIPATTWTQRTLNTVKTNNIASASLSSNRISLPSGTYLIDATVPAMLDADTGSSESLMHKAKLYNVTATTDLVIGTLEYGSFSISVVGEGGSVMLARSSTPSRVRGYFTIASTSNVELRTWASVDCEGGPNGDSEGSAVSVLTDVLIWKLT